MSIELLLCHADDLTPVIENGLPDDASTSAPHGPQKSSIETFRHDGGDPNSLVDQRWGLVVPDGPEGDRLLALVEPLRKMREMQQDGPALVFRAPSGMSPEDAACWWSDVYCDEAIDEADRPRYLAMLGDAHQLSWDLQQRLAADAFVGRICCPDDAGYEAYVEKVLRWERKPPADGCRALFHTVRDGTRATNTGYAGLMVPALEQSRLGLTKGTFNAREIVEIGGGALVSADDFVASTTLGLPSMLFSMSHGIGAPRRGFPSPEAQRKLQGAMNIHGTLLDAESLATRPFLPGGLWFYFACFGAGTPHVSAYHQWLGMLRDVGLYGGKIDAVLTSLPTESQQPFVAALPKALLANPEGPLAIMGHVDLAWTFSFHDGTNARPSRFQDIFRTIVDGKRVGAAYFELQRLFNQASVDLSTMYDSDKRAQMRGSGDTDDRARKTRRATLWMLRQDLSAYVLLGDPAANLNIATQHTRATNKPRLVVDEVASHRAVVPAEIPLPRRLPTKFDPRIFEAALFDPPVDDLLDVLAARWGISRAELDRLVMAYREAGRTAVTSLISNMQNR